MTDTERIIDKVRKLQAHADSAAEIGSEEEAEAFAAKVQELLTARGQRRSVSSTFQQPIQ